MCIANDIVTSARNHTARLTTNDMVSDRPTSPPSTKQANNDLRLLEIIALITSTLGIHVQPQHQETCENIILSRVKALGLSSLDAYYEYLLTKKQLAPGEPEWQTLILQLTVTETYFFRDQGQFWLLRHQILPALIEQKRQLCLSASMSAQRPTLRLWSAGCSTGEEAYSLAILAKELIPDYREWDILILGTDINQSAIALARQGFYGDWSFRATESDVKNRYFRSHRKGWEIDGHIRQMVTFRPGNLVQDAYPSYPSKIYDLDLIVCRNVFIYFDFATITLVLEKFYRALGNGGVLMTGHTELHGQNIEPFQVKNFSQSVIYQKHIAPGQQATIPVPPLPQLPSYPKITPGKNTLTRTQNHNFQDNDYPNSQVSHSLLLNKAKHLNWVSPAVKSTTQNHLLDEAQRSLTQKAYADTIHAAKQIIALAPQHFQAYCLMAEAYANLGQYTHATHACEQALQINSLATEPYHLLAQIAEETDDLDSAKLFLKRIIYLEPTAIAAYLELGAIYEREVNPKQAKKIWQSLLMVLHNLPSKQMISSGNQQTIAELKAYLLQYLLKQ